MTTETEAESAANADYEEKIAEIFDRMRSKLHDMYDLVSEAAILKGEKPIDPNFERAYAFAVAKCPPRKGIRYPGDDGSEPEDVREAKAQAYADEVLAKAAFAAEEGKTPTKTGEVLFSKSGRRPDGTPYFQRIVKLDDAPPTNTADEPDAPNAA